MEPTDFIVMVNNFDEAKKSNLKWLLYSGDTHSNASNNGGNYHLNNNMPLLSQESNPICDEIKNTRASNLQIEPTFDKYNVERFNVTRIFLSFVILKLT